MTSLELTKGRALRRTCAAALAICGLAGAGAATAAASPVLKLAPASGTPGTVTKLTGTGFAANETLQLQFDATSAGIAVADDAGAFHSVPLAVPTTATPRAHVIAAVGPAAAPSATATFTVTSPWAQGGLDARRLGDNPFENYLTSDTVGSLDRAWTGSVPDVSQGGAAVTTALAVVGDQSGRLTAFAPHCAVADGVCPPRWTATTGGAITGTPAISGSTVYAGSDDGKLYAFKSTCAKNGATCTPLWTGLTTAGAELGAPAVSGSTVFVPSSDGSLYAFPTTCTGSCAPKWTASLGYKGLGVAVSSGRVFVRTLRGVETFSASGCGASTCSPIWIAYALGISGAPTPVVSNGVLYVGSGNQIFGYPVSCGTGGAACSPTQTFGTNLSGMAGIAIAGGRLYATDMTGKLQAFTASCASSCPELWHAYIGDFTLTDNTTPPIVAADVVYFATPQGLAAYNANCRTDSGACTPLWTAPPGAAYYGMTESDGTLYTSVKATDGTASLAALTPNGQGIPG